MRTVVLWVQFHFLIRSKSSFLFVFMFAETCPGILYPRSPGNFSSIFNSSNCKFTFKVTKWDNYANTVTKSRHTIRARYNNPPALKSLLFLIFSRLPNRKNFALVICLAPPLVCLSTRDIPRDETETLSPCL